MKGTTTQQRLTATAILKLIAFRHTNDVFVPECKDGATIFGSHFRLDAWAMKRSWTHQLSVGYEIKVSRSDFLRDNKIPAYLDMCNELYLVAPADIIQPSEVPEHCGLMIPASTGSRLFTKKRAPYREIEEPALLYKYILMSRAAIDHRRYGRFGTRSYWERWLKGRIDDHEFGCNLRGKLRKTLDEKVTAVEAENRRLADKNRQLAEIKAILDDLGLSPRDYWNLSRNVAERVEAMRSGIDKALGDSLDTTRSAARALAAAIDGLSEAVL